MKNKYYMMISTDTERQKSTFICDKNSQQSGYKGNVPQYKKGYI